MKITLDELNQFYDTHEKASVKTFEQNYKAPVVRVISNCKGGEDVVKCLKKFDDVVEYIVDNHGKSINTMKVYLQAILWFVDHYPGLAEAIPKAREVYLSSWEETKLAVAEAPNKEYKDLPKIEDIQKAVNKSYGSDSIQSLYIAFYREVPMRLDFKDIKVYGSANQVPEDTKKYVILQSKKFIAEEYNKTSEKYGSTEYPLSTNLVQKIRNSLSKTRRDQLFVFSNSNPSKAISGLLRGAGIDMTLNGLRHLMSTTALTPEEKVKMAKKMKHSIETSRKYREQVVDV